MKITLEKVNSGPACGKQYIRFIDNVNKTIGCIQPIALEFHELGGTTKFIVESYKTDKTSISNTIASAITDLFGVNDINVIDLIVDEIVNQVGGENLFKERQWL